MRRQRLVELILHHPRLDPDPPPHGIDPQDPVHVAREVDDEAVGQRLPVRAGAAPARGKLECSKARLRGKPRDPNEIIGALREGDRLRDDLVDRVVGREHRAVGMGEAELSLEAAGTQLGEELDMERGRRGHLCQTGYHRKQTYADKLVRELGRAGRPMP